MTDPPPAARRGTRPRLGFYATCIPSRRGVGWEQRAFAFVEAYRGLADLDMVCAPYAEPDLGSRASDLSDLEARCARFELVVPPHAVPGSPPGPPPYAPDGPTPYGSRSAPQVRAAVKGLAERVSVVHAMRELGWAPLREHFPSRRVLLDLDEVPRWLVRDSHLADYREYLLGRCEFPAIFVSSPVERKLLGEAASVQVIDNPVPIPDDPVPPAPEPNLLLVGNLGFGPNRDSIRYFITEVLPLLWREAAEARLTVVGRGDVGDLAPLFRDARVSLQRNVPDLRPWYEAARIAVAPLRDGAGTKIKILEAFAHGIPVVTTPVGLEGLGVDPGRHALIGNSAQQLADACVLLLEHPSTASRLVEAARSYVVSRHASDRIEASIAEATAPHLAALG